ncbi:MAG: carboxypeptidase regulatory-like domain-containing protein [Candidatus Sumerlaeia bacterium]|nr:carboxypeptidase regulatory-like domain-containing protein [Candidatus Sumerlaeia bacterium]
MEPVRDAPVAVTEDHSNGAHAGRQQVNGAASLATADDASTRVGQSSRVNGDGVPSESASEFEVLGRVIDKESSQPIPGAAVVSVSGDAMGLFTGELEEHHGTKSDGDGRFSLADPVMSVMHLERLAYIRISSDGFVPRLVMLNPATLDSDVELDITLERGMEISGRVETEDGNPVEGANVIALSLDEVALQPGLVGQMGSSSLVTTVTGEDGRFVMTAPRHGGLAGMLRATKEGYIPATAESYTMVEEQVLVLRRAKGTLVGTARWHNGLPVVDGLVTVEVQRVPRGGIPIFLTTQTDAAGSFTMDSLPTGDYVWSVAVQGVLPGGGAVQSPHQRIQPSGSEPVTMNFELADMAILHGRVVRGDNEEGLSGVRLSNVPFDRDHAVNWRLEQRRERREFVTASDGRFTLEVMPVENVYPVYYELPSGWLVERQSTPGRMETGNPDAELVLRAVQAHVYRGRLVMADGNTGVPNQEIEVKRPQGGNKTATTNDTGRFEFTAIPGTLVTLLAQTDRGVGRETVLLDETKETAEIVVRLGSTGEISGHVRNAKGEGLGNVRVILHPSGVFRGQTLARENTDDRGYFYFEDIPAGEPLGLSAHPMSGVPYSRGGISQFVLDPGEYRRDLDIILAGTRSLSVYVYNEEEEPIEGAQVSLMEERTEGHTSFTTMGERVTTDDNGHVLIDNLSAGDTNYSISVSASGYQGAHHRLEREEGEIHLTLERSHEVIIRVVDGATGQPIPDYEFTVEQVERFASGSMTGTFSTRVQNAQDGAYSYTRIHPGRFRIAVEAGNLSAMEEFRFAGEDGGDPSPWTLEARPSPEVTALVILDETEEPVEGVGLQLARRVRLGGMYSWTREGVSDDQGRVRFENVLPGNFDLKVAGDGWGQVETVRLSITQEGVDGDEPVIRIAPPGALWLTVLGWDGNPASHAVVEHGGAGLGNRDLVPFKPLGEGVFELRLEETGFINYRVGLDGYTKFGYEHVTSTAGVIDATVDLSEYTRVDATVHYNGVPWQGNPLSFHVQRVNNNGVLQQSLQSERILQTDIGHGRLLARPGIVVPSILIGSQGWVPLGVHDIPESSEPVTMEIDMHTQRFDVGIVYPPEADFIPGVVTVYLPGLEAEGHILRMDQEGRRHTIGYTSGQGFRLEFESEDGEWVGETDFTDTRGNVGEHLLIDVFPVE